MTQERKEFLETLEKDSLIDIIAKLEADNEDAAQKIASYENNGSAKLYYSLLRKSNEMADLLNANKLTNLQIDDPKDKSFDRLKAIWSDADSLSNAIKTLGQIAGITGDEEKDTKKKPFVDTLAQKRNE